MADLSELLALHDALVKADATGIQTIEHNGERITYKDVGAALARLEDRILAAGGTLDQPSGGAAALISLD